MGVPDACQEAPTLPESTPLPAAEADADTDAGTRSLARIHRAVGWSALALFLGLGLVLDAFHAWKTGWYLDVSAEVRRRLWTLAHAHGSLLGLVHVFFSLSVARLPQWGAGARETASRCLSAATILLPGGFLLGGAFLHDGEPGLGIALVAPGALLLLLSVGLTARAATR